MDVRNLQDVVKGNKVERSETPSESSFGRRDQVKITFNLANTEKAVWSQDLNNDPILCQSPAFIQKVQND